MSWLRHSPVIITVAVGAALLIIVLVYSFRAVARVVHRRSIVRHPCISIPLVYDESVGEYFMSLWIGSREISVVPDTGSCNLVVAGPSCSTCASSHSQVYNPHESSSMTLSAQTTHSDSTEHSPQKSLKSQQSQQPQRGHVRFGSQSHNVIWVHDEVSLMKPQPASTTSSDKPSKKHSKSSRRFPVGVMTSSTNPEHPPLNVLGLGFPSCDRYTHVSAPLTTYWKHRYRLRSTIFSFHGDRSVGRISFGVVPPSHVTWCPAYTTPSSAWIRLHVVHPPIRDSHTDTHTDSHTDSLKPSQALQEISYIMIDTGSTNSILPSKLWTEHTSEHTSKPHAHRHTHKHKHNLSTLSSISVQSTSKSPVTLSLIPPGMHSAPPSRYLSANKTSSRLQDTIILGNQAMMHFTWFFDMSRHRVGVVS